MIQPYEVTIGSLIRTNRGEIIRVESISSKSQNRKVGYHSTDDPCRMKYVRLAVCEGIDITPAVLESVGYEFVKEDVGCKKYVNLCVGCAMLIALRVIDGQFTGEVFVSGMNGFQKMSVHNLQMKFIAMGFSYVALHFFDPKKLDKKQKAYDNN